MAIQSLGGSIMLPVAPFGASAAPSYTNHLLDAASEKSAAIFRIPKTGTLAKLCFRTGAVTTGATVDVRLETLDASGDPSGTLAYANSNGSQVVSTTNNTWYTTAITSGTVTRGQERALVIVNHPTTPGNMNITHFGDDSSHDFPYIDLYAPASWSKGPQGPIIGLEYSDGSYYHIPGVWPMATSSRAMFNSSDGVNERGLKFQVPFPCTAWGVWAWMEIDAALDLILYDSARSVLQSISIASAVRVNTNADLYVYPFDADQSLTANTTYRLVIKPTSITDVGICWFTVNSAAVMDSFEGGQNFSWTQWNTGGTPAWEDTTTKRPFMGLMLSGFDDGAGGGGVGVIIGG